MAVISIEVMITEGSNQYLGTATDLLDETKPLTIQSVIHLLQNALEEAKLDSPFDN